MILITDINDEIDVLLNMSVVGFDMNFDTNRRVELYARIISMGSNIK